MQRITVNEERHTHLTASFP